VRAWPSFTTFAVSLALPRLLCDALDLFCSAGVGQFLVADSFADTLLDLACYLIEFSFYFIGILMV
jgi:hypothetical protein